MSTVQETLLEEIVAFCKASNMAATTFGREAVNDGKFVGRLRQGKRVTTATVERVRQFIADNAGSEDNRAKELPKAGKGNGKSASETPSKNSADSDGQNGGGDGQAAFRFYDNRQKYLLFVNTCSEKWVVADRVGEELARIHPKPPAVRVYDAGMGDGTVLTRLMRQMHCRFPTFPFYIVGKEVSLEDVRLGLEKMPDRFHEHPATVLVVTNLYYTESPWLSPGSVQSAAALNWIEVPLSGDTAHEFESQITDLQSTLADGWQVRSSEKTGNPLYVRPSVLVLYREDHKFLLDQVIPRPGFARADYDLVVASQPYRARMPVEFKVEKVIAPLAKALGPGGRLIGVHSHGNDPGLEIVQKIWPGEEPFQTDRHTLLKVLKQKIGSTHRDLNFKAYSDQKALLRYHMHTLPSEIDRHGIGTSTLLAAWNAAIYVAQIEDARLEEAMVDGAYLDATREVLAERGGLWFFDESFVVSRRRV